MPALSAVFLNNWTARVSASSEERFCALVILISIKLSIRTQPPTSEATTKAKKVRSTISVGGVLYIERLTFFHTVSGFFIFREHQFLKIGWCRSTQLITW